MHACPYRRGVPRAPAILFAAVVALTACGMERQAATSNGNLETDIVSGSYRVTAVLGADSLAGRLDVRSDGEVVARGRVTLHVGRDLHFAIRAEDSVGDTARFLTSSPARRLTLRWIDDAVEGELDLGAGRIAAITGSMDGPYPAELDDHFALDPIEGLEPERTSSGRSFPTLTAGGERVLFSQYEDGDFSHQTIMVANRQGVGWDVPSVATFSGRHSDRAPMLDPSTGDLIFASTRPLPGSDGQAESYNLWRIEDWTRDPSAEPEPVSPVNSKAADYQPSVTSEGVLFFVSERDGDQDVYRAEPDEGAWSTPVALPDPVNTPDAEMSVFAARDGSYIVFSSARPRDDHAGNEDLYISRWTGAGWSTPRNLGLPVNSFANEYGAYVSADGEWLYFTSDRTPPARLYRVEASRYLGGTRP